MSANNTALAKVSNNQPGTRIYFSSQRSHIAWLAQWSGELQSAARHYFMPEPIQKAIVELPGNKGEKLRKWLEEYPKITELSISSFAKQLQDVGKSSTDSKLVINVAHFSHFSSVNRYIEDRDLFDLCSTIPIVDGWGTVRQHGSVNILLPASISKWAKLMRSQQWTGQNFVELSEYYLTLPRCARGFTEAGKDLVSFVKQQLGALDIPQLIPTNAHFPFNHLDKESAFVLLDWIGSQELPPSFKQSVLDCKWLKTGRGFESPAKSFLFDSKMRLAQHLEEDDVPCIDEAFYGYDIHNFKDALEKIGVVTEEGGGCDVIVDHHIQMHTDFKTIKRLYSYLHVSEWESSVSSVLPIWIPNEQKWTPTGSCVIHDVNGLFKSRLKILENWYDEELLNFFSKSLRVPDYPQIEDYCLLWRDWGENGNHGITESVCCLVWKHIVHECSSSSSLTKQYLGSGCKVPVCANNGDIRVSSASQAYIPDDLQLKELFKGRSSMVNFTWHPNPSDPQIPLDSLFSIYNHLGVRNISQAVTKTEISMQQRISWQRLKSGEGILGMGLYRVCVAYLAEPSFNLHSQKRHQLVKSLMECPVYGVVEPLSVEYSLLSGQNIKVNTTAMVRWEKSSKRLLIQIPDRNHQKARMMFVTNFAEVISQGLLAEFPDLVGGLCELIKLGCAFDFNSEAVDFMLQSKNLQLFIEDEGFLSSYSS